MSGWRDSGDFTVVCHTAGDSHCLYLGFMYFELGGGGSEDEIWLVGDHSGRHLLQVQDFLTT
jgi:hypothetical protein